MDGLKEAPRILGEDSDQCVKMCVGVQNMNSTPEHFHGNMVVVGIFRLSRW
jgi:hypothetical protein